MKTEFRTPRSRLEVNYSMTINGRLAAVKDDA
jgi:hypothetical protein